MKYMTAMLFCKFLWLNLKYTWFWTINQHLSAVMRFTVIIFKDTFFHFILKHVWLFSPKISLKRNSFSEHKYHALLLVEYPDVTHDLWCATSDLWCGAKIHQAVCVQFSEISDTKLYQKFCKFCWNQFVSYVCTWIQR